MRKKKVTSLFLTLALSLSLLAGCGNTENSQSEIQQSTSTVAEAQTTSAATEQEGEIDDSQADAEQLLSDLKGTYQELWPIVLSDEYKQLWLDDSAAIVGDDNAEAAFEKMSSMVTGTVTGEAAVDAYKDGNMAYDCEFLQNVDQFFDYILSNQIIVVKPYNYLTILCPCCLYAFKNHCALPNWWILKKQSLG